MQEKHVQNIIFSWICSVIIVLNEIWETHMVLFGFLYLVIYIAFMNMIYNMKCNKNKRIRIEKCRNYTSETQFKPPHYISRRICCDFFCFQCEYRIYLLRFNLVPWHTEPDKYGFETFILIKLSFYWIIQRLLSINFLVLVESLYYDSKNKKMLCMTIVCEWVPIEWIWKHL